jgi:hypothetical protein
MNNDWHLGDRIKVNGIKGVGIIDSRCIGEEYVHLQYTQKKDRFGYSVEISKCINLSANGRKTARTTKRNEKGKYVKKLYSRRQENDIFDNKVTEIKNIPDPASMPFEHNEQVRYYFNKMIEWNNKLDQRIKKLEEDTILQNEINDICLDKIEKLKEEIEFLNKRIDNDIIFNHLKVK